jgi:hypothetical protein
VRVAATREPFGDGRLEAATVISGCVTGLEALLVAVAVIFERAVGGDVDALRKSRARRSTESRQPDW